MRRLLTFSFYTKFLLKISSMELKNPKILAALIAGLSIFLSVTGLIPLVYQLAIIAVIGVVFQWYLSKRYRFYKDQKIVALAKEKTFMSLFFRTLLSFVK